MMKALLALAVMLALVGGRFDGIQRAAPGAQASHLLLANCSNSSGGTSPKGAAGPNDMAVQTVPDGALLEEVAQPYDACVRVHAEVRTAGAGVRHVLKAIAGIQRHPVGDEI
jgi:hypothetical protein